MRVPHQHICTECLTSYMPDGWKSCDQIADHLARRCADCIEKANCWTPREWRYPAGARKFVRERYYRAYLAAEEEPFQEIAARESSAAGRDPRQVAGSAP